jgi:hypothetical protein
MKKFLIPGMVLALGIGVAGIHSASAATLTSAQIIAKSDTAITTRITSLNKVSAKIAAFKHLTSDQKTSLTATVQSSINDMTALKAKIDGETDLATLKADYASITKKYRVYMVVVPSTETIAATDNAMANITTYQADLVTLNAKIAAHKTAGKDVSVQEALSSSATAKLTDAQSQAQSLVSAITSLQVDNGDTTIQTANKTHLATAKTARAAMFADLSAARKDIASIRSGLKSLK